jgi:PleD family two-component response regulator
MAQPTAARELPRDAGRGLRVGIVVSRFNDALCRLLLESCRHALDQLGVRAEDVVARLGGDEFGIIAVGASPTQAGELVTRLEDALRRAGIDACTGYAPYQPTAGLSATWDNADQAMYRQKRRKHARLVSTLQHRRGRRR